MYKVLETVYPNNKECSVTLATHTLVLSWSGLLSQMFHGHDGVGSEAGEMYYSYQDDRERCEEIYGILCDILLSAEADGRVAWREQHQTNSYQQLNEFLVGRGLPAIIGPVRSSYFLPDVHWAVQDQGLPYRVISTRREQALSGPASTSREP